MLDVGRVGEHGCRGRGVERRRRPCRPIAVVERGGADDEPGVLRGGGVEPALVHAARPHRRTERAGHRLDGEVDDRRVGQPLAERRPRGPAVGRAEHAGIRPDVDDLGVGGIELDGAHPERPTAADDAREPADGLVPDLLPGRPGRGRLEQEPRIAGRGAVADQADVDRPAGGGVAGDRLDRSIHPPHRRVGDVAPREPVVAGQEHRAVGQPDPDLVVVDGAEADLRHRPWHRERHQLGAHLHGRMGGEVDGDQPVQLAGGHRAERHAVGGREPQRCRGVDPVTDDELERRPGHRDRAQVQAAVVADVVAGVTGGQGREPDRQRRRAVRLPGHAIGGGAAEAHAGAGRRHEQHLFEQGHGVHVDGLAGQPVPDDPGQLAGRDPRRVGEAGQGDVDGGLPVDGDAQRRRPAQVAVDPPGRLVLAGEAEHAPPPRGRRRRRSHG